MPVSTRSAATARVAATKRRPEVAGAPPRQADEPADDARRPGRTTRARAGVGAVGSAEDGEEAEGAEAPLGLATLAAPRSGAVRPLAHGWKRSRRRTRPATTSSTSSATSATAWFTTTEVVDEPPAHVGQRVDGEPDLLADDHRVAPAAPQGLDQLGDGVGSRSSCGAGRRSSSRATSTSTVPSIESSRSTAHQLGPGLDRRPAGRATLPMAGDASGEVGVVRRSASARSRRSVTGPASPAATPLGDGRLARAGAAEHHHDHGR